MTMPFKKNSSVFAQILSSKLFMIAGLAVLIFFGVSLSKEITRRFEISGQVRSLKLEITELETRNQEISELIEYLKSESYREKQARLKLGLQKEGESLIILPPSQDEPGVQSNLNSSQPENERGESKSPKKWWDYFFK